MEVQHMESRAKLAGHAIHPMLIVFPLGLLAMAVVFEGLYLTTGTVSLATAAFWNTIAGIVTGLVAAVFGLWDWLAIPSGTRAKRIGLLHGAGNVILVALFTLSVLLRLADPAHSPTGLTFVLELVAAAVALITGWLGGELVERLGVGVDPRAHLDAPSSLSPNPAVPGIAGFPVSPGNPRRMGSR
jgi:uncharacterized membrane protein